MNKIKEWWSNKSPKEKWKVKAGIAWFGGGFTLLIIIVETLFMPKINKYLNQATPSELIEVEYAINNQMYWMLGIMSIIIVISIIVQCWLSRNDSVEEG